MALLRQYLLEQRRHRGEAAPALGTTVGLPQGSKRQAEGVAPGLDNLDRVAKAENPPVDCSQTFSTPEQRAMTAELRWRPIPKTPMVKLTLALSATLKANLDRYAQLHAEAWGEQTDAVELIPHMLEELMARDCGFRKARRPDGHPQSTPARNQ